ncbi:hypothetical protein ACWD48_06170 [Streptomyces sp. NPDC002519]
MNSLLDLIAANRGEAEDASTAIVGDSVYVRYANDLAVLKISARPGAGDETRITLQLINPERGPIDTADFVHTRSQNLTKVLERLDAYQDIWQIG